MKSNAIFILIEPFELKVFTPNVKDSWDYAGLLVGICKFVIEHADGIRDEIRTDKPYMKITYGKCNRCYVYVNDEKYLSFVFPLNYSFKDNVFWIDGMFVDSKTLHDISALILSRRANDSLIDMYFANGMDDDAVEDKVYYILEKLISTEPGYIRHDKDVKNEKGLVHPLTHLDVNYSTAATFKIGTYQMLSKGSYENVFDKMQDCLYIDIHKGFSN